MRRLVRRLPLWVRAQPLDTLLSVLGIPSGVASLVGAADSRALAALLPQWAVYLWSINLIVGCVCWLAGASSVREQDGHLVTRRLPIYVLGLHLLSLSCAVYGVAILVIGGAAGLLGGYPLLVIATGLYIRRVNLTEGPV
jgi:hypothetical protein